MKIAPLSAALFLSSTSSLAFACVDIDEKFRVAQWVISFASLTAAVLALGGVLWLVLRFAAKRKPQNCAQGWCWLMFIATMLFVLLLVAAPFIAPSFKNVFDNWGAELPNPTHYLLQYAAFPPLLALGIGAANIYMLKNARLASHWPSFLGAFLLTSCLVASIVWALYLPIFKLGC